MESTEYIGRDDPLLVIVGVTASGKSDLALYLAKKFKGEIICADSRTVYRGMDIGTAKPTNKDQAQIPHHIIDIKNPDQTFNVADYKKLVGKVVKDIHGRGKLPILVGGSGLYIDAIIYGFTFNLGGQRDLRNPRHLLKAQLEESKKDLRPNTLIIGLKIEKSKLKNRIEKRVESMVKSGLTQEVRTLANKYGWDHEAMKTPANKAFHGYINNKINLNDAKSLLVRYDMQLAKRQYTWFKRNNSIHWLSNRREIVELVTTFLNT